MTAGHDRSHGGAVVHDIRDHEVRGEVRGAECRTTRAVMHDYLGRLLPARRERRFEAHMDACPACIRAFIDVRQASWVRRATAAASPFPG